MSYLYRCAAFTSRGVTCLNARSQHLRSINRSLNRSLNHSINQSIRSFARLPLSHYDDYDPSDMQADMMDDDMDDMEDEESKMDLPTDLADQFEIEQKESHRSQKGSKAERLKKIEKEKRRQKIALRARIDKLEKVKPGAKPKRIEDTIEPDHMYPDIDLDSIPDPRRAQESKYSERDEKLARRAAEQKPEAEEEDDGPRVNEEIQGDTIVMIDGSGKRLGLVSRDAALKKVRDAGLDLVQLSPPNVTPPVCKVVRYREWATAEALKRGGDDTVAQGKMKTLPIRKTISPHDLMTKMNHAKRFLREGHPVKIVYLELNPKAEEWIPFFQGIAQHLQGIGKCEDIESRPYAIFSMVRNKQSRKKSEKQTKEANKGGNKEAPSTEAPQAAEIKQ